MTGRLVTENAGTGLVAFFVAPWILGLLVLTCLAVASVIRGGMPLFKALSGTFVLVMLWQTAIRRVLPPFWKRWRSRALTQIEGRVAFSNDTHQLRLELFATPGHAMSFTSGTARLVVTNTTFPDGDLGVEETRYSSETGLVVEGEYIAASWIVPAELPPSTKGRHSWKVEVALRAGNRAQAKGTFGLYVTNEAIAARRESSEKAETTTK